MPKNEIFQTKNLVRLALVAALYAALTLALPGLSFGAIQFRFSEILVLLCFYRKDYSISLILGCFIANCFSPMEQEEMRVFTRFPERAEELLKRWTADNFVELCRKLNAEVRGSLINSGLTPPPTVITIKDMKTRWGSCTPAKGHISINIRLAPYPRQTVLSVVWHEYAHYWHRDHSARFYAFLEAHFPEYRRWNSLLK